jgi:hypothetical protein
MSKNSLEKNHNINYFKRGNKSPSVRKDIKRQNEAVNVVIPENRRRSICGTCF